MEVFQFWTLRTELWDKMFNFEDKVGLLVLKIIVLKKKQPLFLKEFFKSNHLKWSYGTTHSILKIT